MPKLHIHLHNRRPVKDEQLTLYVQKTKEGTWRAHYPMYSGASVKGAASKEEAISKLKQKVLSIRQGRSTEAGKRTPVEFSIEEVSGGRDADPFGTRGKDPKQYATERAKMLALEAVAHRKAGRISAAEQFEKASKEWAGSGGVEKAKQALAENERAGKPGWSQYGQTASGAGRRKPLKDAPIRTLTLKIDNAHGNGKWSGEETMTGAQARGPDKQAVINRLRENAKRRWDEGAARAAQLGPKHGTVKSDQLSFEVEETTYNQNTGPGVTVRYKA